MKSLSKTGITLFFAICMLQWQSPAVAMNAEDAPENLTLDYLQELYEAVDFNHQLHSDMYQCNSCHHHTTGDLPAKKSCRSCHDTTHATANVSCSGCHGLRQTVSQSAGRPAHSVYHIDIPDFKGAIHLQCLGCHAAESGPTGCQDCHAFTPAGRKRFALKEVTPGSAGFTPDGKSANTDDLVKSHLARRDGLWKKLDILGVVSYTATRQYIRYGGSSCKTYNDVDRGFYESINTENITEGE